MLTKKVRKEPPFVLWEEEEEEGGGRRREVNKGCRDLLLKKRGNKYIELYIS